MSTLANVSHPIRVALVEDQQITRDGLALLIGGSPGFRMCGQYGSMDEALKQIRAAGTPNRGMQLSPRQLGMLRMLAERHSYKAGAAALDVGLDTMRSHARKINERLHVHSRSEAVWKALQGRLLRGDKPT